MTALMQQLCLKPPLSRWLGSLLLLCFLGLGAAQAQQAVPALTGHVIDSTGTLAAAQRNTLEAKLNAFEASSGAQVVVLLVPSTQPEDIASYANRVANSWKIGRKDIGDGLLLIVAVQDRKLRIEVAKTLEGAIPDLLAKRIIDEAITPRFKQGDYAGGIDAGLTRIMGLIRGEALPEPSQRTGQNAGGFDWMELGIFLFVAVPVIGAVARSMLGNRLGAMATGGAAGGIAMLLTASVLIAGLAGVAALIFTLVQNTPGLRNSGLHRGGRNGGWGHGGGFGGGAGGFGGGGFGSGGGGDFGGGGASGDW
ncbi:TPM domain-containing protein [Rhodoferax sp.]|uniref:TPM domain-containing protein n=1 Tax=Rhodoferax sp. TaxID=50421 RepID=UPI00271BEAA3|nr:TPM domain-containing protein [Rhodoferax sp.]MDO9144508.1 TPM domain-containing protein [Rhodoferax sp.]MDP1531884.1 TPM domain-containing protein [Rhodoferax sp.]MDP1942801.1 TPM domain-containing protein [Rhodoferax sp.]MDP2443737.1 TPM domain-containing protein [Rhodoferax sp.]MDZ4207832.1 TPM domain-containing protein [Rhodoferax sp.]